MRRRRRRRRRRRSKVQCCFVEQSDSSRVDKKIPDDF
jgi:hypothetical protein